MAKKNHYYVLVITNCGAVFVTDVPHRNEAEWDRLQKPKEFSKEYASDIALGLCCNGYLAYMVCQPFEISNQPYRYDFGCLRWESNDNTMDDVIGWISEHDTVYEDFKQRFPKLVKEDD